MVSQASQVLESWICNVPTCKIGSDLRYWWFKGKLKRTEGRFWSEQGLKIHSPENVSVGCGCKFGGNTTIHGEGGVAIRSNVTLLEGCFINSAKGETQKSTVYIGDDCFIQSGVRVIAGTHNWNKVNHGPMVKADTVIWDDVHLMANAMVLPGVTIGAHTVIGAGSVVSRSIPANSIAFGIPCRVHRRRT